MNDFGHFIKSQREKKEWTQTEFGAKIGINSSAISRIENGTQLFSISKLKQLSEIFGTDIQQTKDLFFADKFAKEAYRHKCSESVFGVAEKAAQYIKNSKLKQGKLEF